MAAPRNKQLAYSELQGAMLDEVGRRQKAAKITSVLRHFLGRDDLADLVVGDVGCSTGFTADELAERGGDVVGFDIDVPGLARANERFAGRVGFVCADGEQLPVADETFDVLVFNHIYEHVVDADAVVAELHRILKPDGVVYLGLANKLGVVEPHYKLPFLSYLPQGLADRYMRATGRGDTYYEQFRTRRGLAKMLDRFYVWDYTYSVLANPDRFAARDMVPRTLDMLPARALKLAQPLIPTFLWVASKRPLAPQGRPVNPAPLPVRR